MQSDPPRPVFSADKANVLANSRVWRRIVTEVFEKEFPQVKLQHQLADSLAMLFITKPTAFNGIIVTDNTFGDILSDESGGLTGSLGLLPSASLAGAPGTSLGQNSVGGVIGLYEPVHGSAPDISGKGESVRVKARNSSTNADSCRLDIRAGESSSSSSESGDDVAVFVQHASRGGCY